MSNDDLAVSKQIDLLPHLLTTLDHSGNLPAHQSIEICLIPKLPSIGRGPLPYNIRGSSTFKDSNGISWLDGSMRNSNPATLGPEEDP
jgi:hypothetical protein